MRRTGLLVIVALLFLIPLGSVYALVNINTADVSELETLTGIGSVKAQAIVDYREDNGLFESIEEIQNVSGIGDATYESIKDDITVGDSEEEDNTSVDDSDIDEEGSEETSGSSSRETSVYADIQVSHTRAVVGMPVRFEGFEDAALEESKPSYKWNFGDGTTGRGSLIHHTYIHPGVYIVSLETQRYKKLETDQITITVVDADVVISNIIPGSGGYIELENQTDVTVDVSGWRLQNTIDAFVFPQKSYIAPNSTIRIASDVLEIEAMEHINLMDIEGQLVTAYPGYTEIIPDSFYTKTPSLQPVDESPEVVSVVEDTEEQNDTQLAAVGLAAGPPQGPDDIDDWVWLFGLLGIIVLASSFIFLMPRKRARVDVLSADDIDILE